MLTPKEIAQRKHQYYLKNKTLYIERAKKWAQENPERIKESMRRGKKKYYEKNKERILAKKKKEYKKRPPRKKLTPEEKEERSRVYAAMYAKTDKAKARRKAWYEKNKERILTEAKSKYKYKSTKKTAGQILNEMKNRAA